MKLLIGANFKMNLSSKETLHSYFQTLKKIKNHPRIDVFFAPQMSRLDYVSQQIMNTGFLL
jgi:triosephosphate isomerase